MPSGRRAAGARRRGSRGTTSANGEPAGRAQHPRAPAAPPRPAPARRRRSTSSTSSSRAGGVPAAPGPVHVRVAVAGDQAGVAGGPRGGRPPAPSSAAAQKAAPRAEGAGSRTTCVQTTRSGVDPGTGTAARGGRPARPARPGHAGAVGTAAVGDPTGGAGVRGAGPARRGTWRRRSRTRPAPSAAVTRSPPSATANAAAQTGSMAMTTAARDGATWAWAQVWSTMASAPATTAR